MEKYTIDTYGVIGNPIAHSKSPEIHTAFAKQTGQSLQYIKILAPQDEFIITVKEFQQKDGKGLNVTIPFKSQAYQWVNQCSPRAKLAEAVNTIIFKKENIALGDNTDGIGLIRDITQNENYSLQRKKVLILGAGGAVQGILAPLLHENPKEITIANRTPEKAIDLAKKFAKLGTLQHCNFDHLTGKTFDMIINGTSASLTEELPPLPASIITPETFCYDLAYGNQPTAFLRWAAQHGAKKCVDGLGMLVEQAAESFYLWRNIMPDTQAVIRKLRTAIKQ